MAVATMTRFAEWLDARMQERGINRNQLAAYMERPSQTVYSWFNDDRIPGSDYCLAIARVLHLDPMIVLREAGHLPPAEEPEPQPEIPAWLTSVLEELDETELRVVDATARGLLRLREERAAYGTPPPLEPPADAPPPPPPPQGYRPPRRRPPSQ